MEQLEKIKDYSKKSIAEKIESLDIDNADPLELMAASKYYEELAKQLRKSVNANAVNEVSKYPKGQKCTVHNVELSTVSKPRYDYSANEQWREISKEIFSLMAVRKEIEAKLREATVKQKPFNIVDDNGEVITFSPVPVTYTDTVNVKLP